MAVVKAPLLSLDATGTVGKAAVFSHWKGKNVLRKQVVPKNPKSGLQVGQRAGMKFGSQNWKNLSATIQGHWKSQYGKAKITPLNAYQKWNQPRIRTNLGIMQDPTNVAGAVEAAPTAFTVTAATKSLLLAWVDSAGANDWCTFIFRSTSAITTPVSSQLIAIIAHGVQKYTDTKLITGTTYHYKISGSETGGTMGTATVDTTGVPT